MIEDKEPQKSDCCDEEHDHSKEDCCEEKHILHESDDCCDDKKKMIFKLPFGRKNIKDMKDFFMLKILSDHEGDGITGYDLGKYPNMDRGSVIGKMEELEKKGLLRKEEEESDGKKKVKFFVTEKGKEHFETLWDTFQETFSFLGDDVPFEHFVKPVFRKKIIKHGHPHHRKPFMHDISQLETKDEVKDYLASLRHRLNIVEKRLKPRLDRLQKAREALNEAINKVESLTEFSQDEIKKIIDEIRNSYKDVWKYHRP